MPGRSGDTMKTNIAKWKLDHVNEITKMMDEYPVVAITRINGIPAKQIQAMRANLKDSGILKVSKVTFFSKALSQSSKKNIQQLSDFAEGQIAFFFTNMNPFKVFRTFEGTKMKSPAKGGEIAPEDITILKGETQFKPGPIVGEFQKAGIPAAIEKGKIIIKKTTTPVKAGEPIPADLAAMLTKLDIFPLTVGLDLRALHESGTIFTRDTLDLDFDVYRSQFQNAAAWALNLGVYAGYPTTLTITPMISKAHSSALNLAVYAGIMNSVTLPILIGKAQAHMFGLASKLGSEALDAELQESLSGAATQAAAPVQAEAPKEEAPAQEEEEEEEVSEEEAVSGLGALFG